MTTSPPIVIIGAGVLGLCTAFELQRRGHAVRVIDPGAANASLVAAGMVAPAMEAALDNVPLEQAQLFRAGRDLWPDFAEAAGINLARRPAEWRGGDVDGIEARLSTLGFAARREGDRVVTDEDYQVEPAQAVPSLKKSLGDAVVQGRVSGVDHSGNLWRVFVGDETIEASAVVVATGAADAFAGLPTAAHDLIAAIQPIRGQIGVMVQALTPHTVRGPGAYVAPMADGSVVGATMEPGSRDTAPDAATGERLTDAAWRVLDQTPELLKIEWRAGVRGASSDGLPMAGPAPDAQGLFFALAPRRNGWLLGPLVALIVADAVEGRTPSQEARALDPRRF